MDGVDVVAFLMSCSLRRMISPFALEHTSALHPGRSRALVFLSESSSDVRATARRRDLIFGFWKSLRV